jgi:putative ABC transport system ATP-binding protein
MTALALEHVTYRYDGAPRDVLRDVTARFHRGNVYTIVGKSGSGKSTLLSLIAGLDVSRSGRVLFEGEDLKSIDRDAYRARGIGVIFQAYNLITNATAVQNIVLSMHISGSKTPDKRAHAYGLLERVGIDRETADRTVLKLSGGEQQRVGIARALSHDPSIVIADEPTGNLDGETEDEILGILTRLAHEENRCVVIVTHSRRVTAIADEVLGMQNGRLGSIRKTGARA